MPQARHDARGGPDVAPKVRQMVRMERPGPGKENPGHAKGNIGELSRRQDALPTKDGHHGKTRYTDSRTQRTP